MLLFAWVISEPAVMKLTIGPELKTDGEVLKPHAGCPGEWLVVEAHQVVELKSEQTDFADLS